MARVTRAILFTHARASEAASHRRSPVMADQYFRLPSGCDSRPGRDFCQGVLRERALTRSRSRRGVIRLGRRAGSADSGCRRVARGHACKATIRAAVVRHAILTRMRGIWRDARKHGCRAKPQFPVGAHVTLVSNCICENLRMCMDQAFRSEIPALKINRR